MAILRYSGGLAQADKCPKCSYLVFWVDMHYENEEPVICRFCCAEQLKKKAMEPKEMRGALSEIYILATSCVSVNAPEETHKLAKSVVSRILSAGYSGRPSWFVHDWERLLWEARERGVEIG